MISKASITELVDQAHRRARLSAALGRLLLAEPGPDVAPLVAGVEALEPLGVATADLATDYERLFLRGLVPYESVFRSGQLRGGGIIDDILATYSEVGFEEHQGNEGPRRRGGGWRVAGPDHLGLELRCYATLCVEEARSWTLDEPDRAVRAVESERTFLAQHIGCWAELAASSLVRRAGTSPYRELAHAIDAFVAGEVALLRPNPDHPGLPDVEVTPPPPHMGPARLARWLLSPGSSGVVLDADDLAAAARALGIPWRPSDPRSRLARVVEAAADAGDLEELLTALRPAIATWVDHHRVRESERVGGARLWREWRLRAQCTLDHLDSLLADPIASDLDEHIVVTLRHGDDRERSRVAAQLVAAIQERGLRVAVSADSPDALLGAAGTLLDAGAEELLLFGHRLRNLGTVDHGLAPEGEGKPGHAAGFDVVIHLGRGTDEPDIEISGYPPWAAVVHDVVRPLMPC
jgi:TorA maturation chaperone TorD